MKSIRTQLPFLLFILLAAFLTTQSISAFEFKATDRFTLPASDTIPDDFYITCGGAQFMIGSESRGPGGAFIEGTVLGDVCLFGGAYYMTGEIQGNLNSASQRATVRGKVGRTARLAGEYVTFDGEIGKDIIVFARETELGSSSVVRQDASIMGEDVSLNGTIERNVIIYAKDVIISGKIGGDVNIEAESITIVSPAEIDGDLQYKSRREIKIDDDVIIGGEIDWEKVSKDKDKTESETDWGLEIVLFFCSLVTGLIMISLFKHHTSLSVAQMKAHWLPSFGLGFVFIFAAPFAMIILMITIIGIPAAIILLFAYTVFFYIAKIYTAIVLGNIIINAFRKNVEPKNAISLVTGLLALTIIFHLPFIGWLGYIMTLFFGLGALLRGIHECRKKITQPVHNE
ncbi:MAG: polymer-forming cytoskeletal protein [candidate division Zixibacteria bacterium]|nr:polymer-forming cytoskeletal protein [candidate division Zixibacteria bacterium]